MVLAQELLAGEHGGEQHFLVVPGFVLAQETDLLFLLFFDHLLPFLVSLAEERAEKPVELQLDPGAESPARLEHDPVRDVGDDRLPLSGVEGEDSECPKVESLLSQPGVLALGTLHHP